MNTHRGMALITVMGILTLMATVTLNMLRDSTAARQLAQGQRFKHQAKWTLDGAEHIILNGTTSPLPGNEQSLRLEEHEVRYRWHDRNTCFNLNALVVPAADSSASAPGLTAAQRVFAALLQNYGMNSAQSALLTQAISARLFAQSATRPLPVLDTPSQLRHFGLIPSALWPLLAQQLCVLPSTTLSLNLNALTTATAPLFRALLLGLLDDAEVARIIAQRPAQGWHSREAFLQALPRPLPALSSHLQSVTRFDSREWELELWMRSASAFAVQRTRLIQRDRAFEIRYRLYGLTGE